MTFYQNFKELVKLRLSLLVVFSAVVSFYIGANNGGDAKSTSLWFLIIGGFLVTAAANIFNEMIEVESDKLMTRTQKRPLPSKSMSSGQALIVGLLFTLVGTILLFKINVFVCLLSVFCILFYAFIYTPMKKVHPIAVFIGSFPGALPVSIGYFAAFDMPNITLLSVMLFGIQFCWQFPHFWSIAWVLDEDYKKAGFRLLPSKTKNKTSALWITLSCLVLLVIGVMVYNKGFIGFIGFSLQTIICLLLVYYSILLVIDQKEKVAKKIMYLSFLYLPIILLSFLFKF